MAGNGGIRVNKYPDHINEPSHRVTAAFVRLEPCAGKLACTVLRGLGTGDRPWLLDYAARR
jgi:hypothetical protein